MGHTLIHFPRNLKTTKSSYIIKLCFMLQRAPDLGKVQRVWVLVPSTRPKTSDFLTCNEAIIVVCYHADMDLAVPRAAFCTWVP